MTGSAGDDGTAAAGAVLGLDPGTRRCGLAVSDPDRRVAVGLPTFEIGAGRDLVDHVRGLLRAYDVRRIVVGEPRTLRGEVGAAARHARALARRLRRELAIEVELWDERLTSAAGRRLLRGTRAPKGARDRIAAVLILQGWLDRHGVGEA
jgi:putative Holliday junction resolvase